MNESTGNFLSQQLYPDLKSWLITLYKNFKIPFLKSQAKLYKSPNELLNALKSNQLKPNSWVILECKPSMFGTFLRHHLLSPSIGMHSDMRLGPQILSENPIIQIMGNTTSHLQPVGLYPPIDDNLYQLSLYPSDAIACGFIGIIPEINNLVETIPAISNSKNLAFCGMPSHVKGIVRQIDPQLLIDAGFQIEVYEELRQKGEIWFLDIAQDECEIVPLDQAITTEMWGGLYASGHIEFEGELNLIPLVEGMVESMKALGFEPHVTQNQAAGQEILVFGKGIRATIETKYPTYALHMDSEIGINYKFNKDRFDRLCEDYLKIIVEVGQLTSTEIKNPYDLDFTYTDSAKAYSVLKSAQAEAISDPLAMAVRDWHRKRGK
ncbi:hypothetical protein [Acinetobacter pittii]|uniref:hypothetical protein n=1 Tax=Acinetobacter pittii TaxID=48296 RepID=UPI00194FAA39|nr:hypothetical protein [Acinetobacter pittii]QRQ14061.1 hypothetical protein I6J46_05015 [Acinetobacter pittii]